MKRFALLFTLFFTSIQVFGYDFYYTYEGQTLSYTVIDEEAKTCQTKAGRVDDPGYGHVNIYNGNQASKDKDLYIPNTAKDKKTGREYTVIRIGELGFYNNSMSSVTIPNSVTEIESSAFRECKKLTSVNISNSVTSIGSDAFMDCSGLTSVNIPNSVTSIGDDAFSRCSGLKEVHVSDLDSWYNIDFYGSFSNPLAYAHNLYLNGELVTGIVIPENVTEIKNWAFSGCSELTSVTIPNSVTSIGSYAFSGCSELTSVTIPNSVTSIGRSAFSGCSELTSVNIPNSVTSIGNAAFKDCSGLTSVNIPNSVTEIENYAFSGCSGLKKLTIEDSSSTPPLYFSDDLFSDCPIETIYLGRNLSISFDSPFKDKETIISVTIGNSVTEICNVAFSGCSGLTSVTIPNSVTSIDHAAFSGCSGLSSLTIPNSVTSIGSYAFSGCSGLTSVTIPNSVTSIGSSAFSGCSGLKELTVEDGSSTLSLGNNDYYGLFSDCPIETIYLGRNLSYAYSPFKDKETIISVTIGNSVTEIVSSAFAGCSGLTLVNIPNSVTSIGGSAFAGCSGLTLVNIPNSVTSIGGSAFSGCSEVISIISDALNPPTIYETTFDKIVIYSAELFVQERAERAYKAEPIWGLFDIKVIEPVSSLTLSVTEWTGFDGESFSIEATILPENTTYKTVTWSSSDEAVATVDVYGNVVAIKEGKATITASCGALYATCTVNVKANGAGIESVEIESVKGENDIRVEGRSIIAPEGSYVYDLKGRRVHPDGLRPGIYIVRIPGAKTTKVLVK